MERGIREIALDLAGVAPGRRVLEVGCGTGTLLLAARERVGPEGEVAGLDAAEPMLARVRAKAARAGAQVELVHGLFEDMPFHDGRFDVVLSSFMIHHLPGEEVIRRGLAEVRRVLRPGGTLLVLDMQAHNRRLTPLLEDVGFDGIESGRRYRVLSFVRAKPPGALHPGPAGAARRRSPPL